jgi:hypothetical protein
VQSGWVWLVAANVTSAPEKETGERLSIAQECQRCRDTLTDHTLSSS